MIMKRPPEAGGILQGTLDMLILGTLVMGPAHGHTIAQAIERTSENALDVEQGSLYPALHRLEDRGWVSSEWGVSENNRKAKFYRRRTHRWWRCLLAHALSCWLPLRSETPRPRIVYCNSAGAEYRRPILHLDACNQGYSGRSNGCAANRMSGVKYVDTER